MKKNVMFLFIVLILIIPAAASDSYYSYTYSYSGGKVMDVAAPNPYQVARVYTNSVLGVDLKSPEDIVTDNNNNFYIIDSEKNSLFIFDYEFNHLKTISEFVNNGKTDTFSKPSGVFVAKNNDIYIADTQNQRIVVLNKEGELLSVIDAPESEVFDNTFVFYPLKMVVDSSGRIFVLVKNVNKGLLHLSRDGEFVGFVGSNKVTYKLSDLIWKSIMTEEQKKQLISFVPVEYSNISLDDSGFIYAVTSATSVGNPIRRLNPMGNDILVRNPLNGRGKVAGEEIYNYNTKLDVYGPSTFVDITQDQRGNFYALDSKRGRIFAYDDEGNLLFIFGGLRANQKGTFDQPIALVYCDENIYVLDRSEKNITKFTPTEYTRTIFEATAAYINQEYESCIDLWNKVLKLNSNFDLAYMKAGYAYYRLQDYTKAMEYFKIANAKEAYSKAYVKQRKIDLNDRFPYYAGGAILLVVLIFAGVRIRRYYNFKRKGANRWKKDLSFAFYIMRHPSDGFWDMKYCKKGSLLCSLLIMASFIVVSIIDTIARSFMFNDHYNTPLDIPYQLRIILIPILIFCIANWSVTTLMDGKGTFLDIVMMLGYSFLPLVIFKFLSMQLTHLISLNELVYLKMFEMVGTGWFCILVFIGMLKIHEYSFSKGFATLILTAISSVIIIFICLLFFSLIQEIAGFIYSIYREISLRIFI